ncbi:DUF2637 domain-containing protein (plasmid) [Mycolicibacterium frederiksbergense]|uniref:DUF2637 domain-containing protein n=1 Tax=Mycolicibacterium frederiksbergense TaxID=117567 RepID=A0A6H0RWY4_9MYCO|nr:DUF2637 domain-containing protein [Mycolicibacterium frederiksbergense]
MAPLTAAPTVPVTDDDLVLAGDEEVLAAPGSAKMLRATRFAAVGITAIIGIASFILSFASLTDLAIRAGYNRSLAPLWPIIVDGTILSATMAVLALGAYGQQQRSNRRFFWWVLALAAMASVGANALHATLPPTAELEPWLKAAIGVVPPVSLLATAHGAAILSRVRPMTIKAVRAHQETQEAQRAAYRRRYWVEVAHRVKEQNPTQKAIADRPVEQIADVLELAHDGAQSKRFINKKTGLHHETVSKLLQAGAAAMGQAPATDSPASQ